MNPEDALVTVDDKQAVKIGGYLLPAEDFSLTRFMVQDLNMSWLHPGGIISSERLFDKLKLGRDMRVLDLGCGLGSSGRYLARRYGCRVTGIDRDPDMLRQASERSRGRRYRNIDYREMDANCTDFEDGSFDRVLVQSVACFNDRATLFREIHRILKADGWLGLNEVTWIQPPTLKVERVTRSTICETFKGAVMAKQWMAALENAGLDATEHEVHAFKTMAPYQMLKEEGLVGTLRIMTRVLTNPEINMRLSAVSDYFRKYPGYFGYGLYLAHKPGQR